MLTPATAGVGQECREAAADLIARIERASIPKATQLLTQLIGLTSHCVCPVATPPMQRPAVIGDIGSYGLRHPSGARCPLHTFTWLAHVTALGHARPVVTRSKRWPFEPVERTLRRHATRIRSIRYADSCHFSTVLFVTARNSSF